jgi:hypothetical protein
LSKVGAARSPRAGMWVGFVIGIGKTGVGSKGIGFITGEICGVVLGVEKGVCTDVSGSKESRKGLLPRSSKGEDKGGRLLCLACDGETSMKNESSERSRGFWKLAMSSSRSESSPLVTRLVMGGIFNETPRGGLQYDMRTMP